MLRSIFTFAGLLALSAAVPIGQDATPSSSSHLKAVRAPMELPRTSPVLDTREASCAISLGCQSAAEEVTGDTDDGTTWGLRITNSGDETATYFLYQNSCDCVPYKYITIEANCTSFVALSTGFQGRIVRGTTEMNLDGNSHLLGTWVEVNIGSDGVAWGNISLIKGCDGAAAIAALDGTAVSTGFDEWLLDGAPDDAYEAKDDGVKVIKQTEALDNANTIIYASRDYLAGKLGYTKAYVDDHHGNPVICSSNGRMAITFYKGRT
ncbi:hypothetical protein F4809DRAFT_381671 [Biscogniauxia mediterranea]|nr:hypothetical protein F4809DRAFT_381671 [Biscogniauxia mediterranea]